MRRVMIAGMGAVSSAGDSVYSTRSAFNAGERQTISGICLSPLIEKPLFLAAGFSAPHSHDEGMRTIQLCVKALAEALDSAALTETELSRYRIGVCLGTTVASQLNDINYYRTYKKTGSAPMDAVDRYLKGNLAEYCVEKYGLSGPCISVVNACSSGTDAIGIGLSWIRANICDIVIAGGADELNPVPYAGFNSLGILSDTVCTPFDVDRSGLNLGEGAGIVILEAEDHVHNRKGRSLACCAGYAAANDAYHLTAPHPEGRGLSVAIEKALSDAMIDARDIAFINAHGTGTKDNDLVEGRVLKNIVSSETPFISTKGYTGHTLGAAGGLEAVFTVMGLQDGWIPLSAGFFTVDEEIGVAPVSVKTMVQGNYAMSTSLAFGGNNAALVIGRIEEDA